MGLQRLLQVPCTVLLPLACPSSPQHTCSLSLQTPNGARTDGSSVWPLPSHQLLTLGAALASLLPTPCTEPLPGHAFLPLTPLPPQSPPSPHLWPCTPSAPVGRSPGEGGDPEGASLSLLSPPAVALASPRCTASSAALAALACSPRYMCSGIPQGLQGLFSSWGCLGLPDLSVLPGPQVELCPQHWQANQGREELGLDLILKSGH